MGLGAAATDRDRGADRANTLAARAAGLRRRAVGQGASRSIRSTSWGASLGAFVVRSHPVPRRRGDRDLSGVIIDPDSCTFASACRTTDTKAKDTTQYKAYTLLSNNFGPGYNGPLPLVFDADRTARSKWPRIPVCQTRCGPNNIAAVVPADPERERKRRHHPGRRRHEPAVEGDQDPRQNIRQRRRRWASRGLSVLVTGTTAINIDTANKLAAALPVFLPLDRDPRADRAAARVPLGAGADQGGARVPADDRRGVRVRRRGCSRTGTSTACSASPRRPDHQLPADHHDRDPVRPGDGLRGVPRLPDEGELRCAPSRPSRR